MWDLNILLPEPELRRAEGMGEWKICPTLATPAETPYAVVRADGYVVSAHATRADAVYAVRVLDRALKEHKGVAEEAEKSVRAKVINPTESRPRLACNDIPFTTPSTQVW